MDLQRACLCMRLNIKNRYNIFCSCSQKLSTSRLKSHLYCSTLVHQQRRLKNFELLWSTKWIHKDTMEPTLETRLHIYLSELQYRISPLSSQEHKISISLGWKSTDVTCEVCPVKVFKQWIDYKTNKGI